MLSVLGRRHHRCAPCPFSKAKANSDDLAGEPSRLWKTVGRTPFRRPSVAGITAEFAAKGQDKVFKGQLIDMRFSIYGGAWCKLFGVRRGIPVHVAQGCIGRRPLESTGYAFFSKPQLSSGKTEGIDRQSAVE